MLATPWGKAILLGRAGAAALPWYLSGGIDAASVVAAYEPASALSLVDASRNLAHIGINHPWDVGSADGITGPGPTLDASGWVFNGTTQFLETGITPGLTWSMIVQFSNAPSANQILAGYYISETNVFGIRPNSSSNHNYWSGVNSGNVAGGVSGGILGMAGRKGYLNGVSDATMAAGTTANARTINIGRSNQIYIYFGGKIQRLLIANVTLSDAQMLAVRNAMLLSAGPPTATWQVVCKGDSLTFGTGSLFNATYPNQLWSLLGLGARITNLGVPSDRLDELTAQATTTDSYISGSFTRNILVVWAGTNDIFLDDETGANVYAELATYCTNRRSAGWKVVVVTCLPRTQAGTPADFETQRSTLNTSIRSGWSTFADALADIAADSRIGDNLDSNDTTYYNADKVHMTNAGYAIVAGVVNSAILTL